MGMGTPTLTRPMSQLLAFSSAVLYGVADFAGGVATRSVHVWRVTAWSQLFGLPLLAVGVIIVDSSGATRADLLYGAAGGLFGLVGLVALYSALAAGTMSIISPLTGTLTAVIPVVWGLASGERISTVQWVGITVALIAVVLIARDHAHARLTARVALQALVASLAFAGFFIVLDRTTEASGVLPLVSARAVTIPIAFIVAAMVASAAVPPKGSLVAVAGAGNADVAANIAILLALQSGPLGISSVLTSLYPAFTVLAAVAFLHERPTVQQRVGIALALLAAVLLVV